MFKKKVRITTLSAIAILIVAGLMACNNEKDSLIEKADKEVEKFSERLESISHDDPDFSTKLTNAIDDFEESIQNISDDIEEKGIETEYDIKRKLDDITGKNQNLKRTLNEWRDKTGDDIEDLGNEVKEEFNELKDLVKK